MGKFRRYNHSLPAVLLCLLISGCSDLLENQVSARAGLTISTQDSTACDLLTRFYRDDTTIVPNTSGGYDTTITTVPVYVVLESPQNVDVDSLWAVSGMTALASLLDTVYLDTLLVLTGGTANEVGYCLLPAETARGSEGLVFYFDDYWLVSVLAEDSISIGDTSIVLSPTEPISIDIPFTTLAGCPSLVSRLEYTLSDQDYLLKIEPAQTSAGKYYDGVIKGSFHFTILRND
jgi:hypothetical protein